MSALKPTPAEPMPEADRDAAIGRLLDLVVEKAGKEIIEATTLRGDNCAYAWDEWIGTLLHERLYSKL